MAAEPDVGELDLVVVEQIDREAPQQQEAAPGLEHRTPFGDRSAHRTQGEHVRRGGGDRDTARGSSSGGIGERGPLMLVERDLPAGVGGDVGGTPDRSAPLRPACRHVV
ncbi:MAG: hypothetical protein R2743_03935 [Ilumatobacteraceae bacterium]